ncbi:TetR-like C-terminal domain-containing protein [Sphingomonas jaspsi]|jgi:AcrR family transcriptional regulator|uniref:TetR-like C-terminal domain-containing protein n=1 Tax=Sphingomonas jaspsi TaxID=392409 RepID=UPI0004B19E62|nr:TetR-like C-terminal domain-containing protein [Sphingomonas jaspsi]
MNGQIDRRARETRMRLGEALLRLGGLRAIDDIRVGDLAREAGIARSTFYAHYQGLDDYLARSFADMLEHFARGDGERSEAILPVGSILDHVAAAGAGADRLATNRNFPAMSLAGEKALRRVAEQRLEARRPALDTTDRRTIASLLAAGFLSLLRDWIDQGRRVPASEIARRYAAAETLILR